MFAEERKIGIVEYIKHNKKATVPELCSTFDVSSATIRNDLRELEQSGLIIRTHGGAIVKSKTGFELNAKQKQIYGSEEKRKIASKAITLIEDGDTIILDTGSTTAELAKLLNRKHNLTVVTNDYAIASIIEDFEGLNVILMGGVVRRGFHCTVGVSGQEMLAGLAVDKAFMAANSFSLTKGATTPDITHAETKKTMIAISTKIIFLCDSSKLGRNSFAQFASPEQVDIYITDSVSDKDRRSFEDLDIEILLP